MDAMAMFNLLGRLAGLSAFISIVWKIISDGRALAHNQTVSQKAAIQEAVEGRTVELKARIEFREDFKQEQHRCDSANKKLEEANRDLVLQLRQSDVGRNRLTSEVSEMRGKLYGLEQIFPNIKIVSDAMMTGERRTTDPKGT